MGATLQGGDEQHTTANSPRPDPVRSYVVGRGARSALVLPARRRPRRPTVIFFHGWGLTGPRAYRAWLRHLAGRGSTVIAPRYQTSLRTWSEDVPDNALAGVRTALKRLPPQPGVVAVGHSVGGVLAVDYGARAAALGLPPAQAIMSIFPGAALRGMPPVPEDDPANLPTDVRRLLVVSSPSDQVVGTAPAQTIYDAAFNLAGGRRELLTVDDPDAGNHFAPVVDSRAVRRIFWRRLDRLVSLAARPRGS